MGVVDIGTLGGLAPGNIVVEAARCADGTDDRIAGNRCAISLFDEAIQCEAIVATAQDVETKSMGMPIDEAFIFKIEFFSDFVHTGPTQVGAVDLFALGVVADDAFARVALRVRG